MASVEAITKLLTDAEIWFGLYEARNTPSHIYDSEAAKQVFERAHLFLNDAKIILESLHNAH